MKKMIIMIAAALALAGCNRDNGSAGATGNDSSTNSGSSQNAPSSGSISTNSNSTAPQK
jgi:hypothetical protein